MSGEDTRFRPDDTHSEDVAAQPEPSVHAARHDRPDDRWDNLPYEFDKCVIDLRIVFLPSDDNAAGRDVIISVTSHRDDPIIVALREGELGPLPPALAGLLSRLEAAMPERERAAQDKKRKEEEDKRTLQKPTRAASTMTQPVSSDPAQAMPTLFAGNQMAEPNDKTATPQMPAVQGSLFG